MSRHIVWVDAITKNTYILTGQQSSPEWRVGDYSDTQFTSSPQDVCLRILDIEHKKRVLDLDRRDRMHSVRATDSRRRALRESKIPNLSFPVENNQREIANAMGLGQQRGRT